MSLLTLIIDVSPPTWGHRHLLRTAQDKSQASKSKPSVGPATLDDVLTSCITLGTSFSCLHRDNTLVVIAATEEEAAVIYPRKGGEGNIENVVMGLEDKRVDGGLLGDYVKLGVAELVNRAVVKRERKEELWKKRQERMQQQSQSTQQPQSQSDPNHSQTQQAQQQSQQQLQSQSQNKPQHKQGAAIAAALSIALCTINRFMVASHAGVSALANASDVFQRREDDGILALMSGGGNSEKSQSDDPSNDSKNNLKTNLLKPRALIVQASPDRTTDYNALMNCAFASLQSNIVIDGCFIPSGSKQDGHNAKSSPYMEQIVDQTRGVYLAVPGGAAQVGGALTEVLMSVFLPEPGRMRSMMNLPRLHSVDFRARCFESGESVDVAEVCNLCLSVFKVRPGERCWTCGALVRRKKLKGKGTGGGNILKQDGENSNHDNDGGLKRMRLN